MVFGPEWRQPVEEPCCAGAGRRGESACRSRCLPSNPAEFVSPQGYPKSARLRRRREYLRVQRSGKRSHTRSFVVVRQPGSSGMPRLGVTVSSKVGNAVVRNRIKRRVRESFRIHRSRMATGVDVVVIAKHGAHDLSYHQIEQELLEPFGIER